MTDLRRFFELQHIVAKERNTFHTLAKEMEHIPYRGQGNGAHSISWPRKGTHSIPWPRKWSTFHIVAKEMEHIPYRGQGNGAHSISWPRKWSTFHIVAKEMEHIPYQMFQNEKKPLSKIDTNKDTLLNYLHKRHI